MSRAIILTCFLAAALSIYVFAQTPAYVAHSIAQAAERQQAEQTTQYLLRALDRASRGPTVQRRVMTITAYTAGPESTGKGPDHPTYGVTSSGYILTEADAWRVAAADPAVYPAGTRLAVSGIGIVTIVDTGGLVRDDHIDIFVGMMAVKEAREFGRQTKSVMIVR